MKLDIDGITGERAWELSKWCGEAAETLRDHCRESDGSARDWWENEASRPEGLASEPRPQEDMTAFADRIQAEGYEWAGVAGERYAEEDIAKARTMRVDRFEPADELDGPAEGEDLTQSAPAIALRFEYDPDLVALLGRVLSRARHSRSGKGRPYSKIPSAGEWSKPSRCWWVRSTYWLQVRDALLAEGVTLTGPLAHPRKVKDGFFEREQKWDVKRCEWR